MFTPWTVSLPSCSSKCICRCALGPSRAMRSQTRESTGKSLRFTSILQMHRCFAFNFSRLEPERSAWLIVSGLIRGSGSYGMWSVLLAGSELHGRFFSHTETQPLNHLTKMRQRADLSFVPNIPILKITCFTIKSVNWQEKTCFHNLFHNNSQ